MMLWLRRMLVLTLVLVWAGAASAFTIDFEEFAHGEVIDASQGHAIATTNLNRPFDLGVVFDTRERGTADPDLEGPNGVDAITWSGGNLAPTTILGNVLIIQENNSGCSAVGDICTSPDDEGSRPAGDFTITFAGPISQFGFDIIDVEGMLENGTVTLFGTGGDSGAISFSEFMAGGLYDQGAVFGNNTANRVSPLTAAQFGLADITSVEIMMAGSGAITNLVPEPGVSLVALGVLAALAGARRRS